MSNKLVVSDYDFDAVKSNLKSFLQSQTSFQDYDFEGSSLNILLDILSYNTHYMAYLANMSTNELYLDSADIRNNIVSLAKMIGYTPSSPRAPRASIDVTLNNATGTSVTMSKGTIFTTSVNDVNVVEDVISVKRAVKNLVQTNFYERPFQPELGCGVRELLFENFTPMTKVFLERKIEEVIVNYEPRVNIQNLAVDDDQDKNRLVVDIYFYVVGVPGPQVVQTFLQRVR